jgi:carbon storage regulator
MLVLKRSVQESVVIGGGIEVTVLSVGKHYARLGIKAPKETPVHRKEVNDTLLQLEAEGKEVPRQPVRKHVD